MVESKKMTGGRVERSGTRRGDRHGRAVSNSDKVRAREGCGKIDVTLIVGHM